MRVIIKPLGMVVIVATLTAVIGGLAYKKNAPMMTGGGSASTAASGTNFLAASRWKFYTEKGAMGRMETMSEKVAGKNLTGFRVIVETMGPQGWNIGLSQPLQTAFRNGDKLLLHFWARSESRAQVSVMVQRNVPGFPHCFEQSIRLTPEWKEYAYPVTAFEMAKWESMVAIHAGYTQGTVDIAGAELVKQ